MTDFTGKSSAHFIVGDVGGTNTRLALYDTDGQLSNFRSSYTSDTQGFHAQIREFLDSVNVEIMGICLGIAGPIQTDRDSHVFCRLTNRNLEIHQERLQEICAGQVILLNDVEAQLSAAAGPLGLSSEAHGFGNKERVGRPTAPLTLVTIGTGFGAAHLHRIMPWTHSSSEAGHIGFTPRHQDDFEILQYLRPKYGHVSLERVIGGQEGFTNLFSLRTQDPKARVTGAEITERAMGGDSDCQWVINTMVRILGYHLGSIALVTPPQKIVLTGTVISALRPWILDKTFYDSFLDHGRFSEHLRQITINFLESEALGLHGCGQALIKQLRETSL